MHGTFGRIHCLRVNFLISARTNSRMIMRNRARTDLGTRSRLGNVADRAAKAANAAGISMLRYRRSHNGKTSQNSYSPSQRYDSMKFHTCICLALALATIGFQARSAGQVLYFPSSDADWAKTTPESLGWDTDALEELFRFVEQTNGKSFLILKDGKIVAERYWTPAGAAHAQYVMSCGKSITAFLVGIAQEQGKLKIDQPASDFLGGGWTRTSRTQEQAIRIEHLLKMTSGLTPRKSYEGLPDTIWRYNTEVYQDLHPLLEKAVGATMQEFSDRVLFRPMGMTHSKFRFHSFVMSARDMGRLGLMILAGGKWNGQPIMKDEAYFRAMLSTSQDLNLSYGYLWWLNGKDSHLTVRAARSTTAIQGPVTPHAPKDLLEANGRGGQHIYVAPSLNLVVVRLGDSPGVFGWDSQLWEKLNLAMRTTSEADGTARTGAPKTTAPKSGGSDIR